MNSNMIPQRGYAKLLVAYRAFLGSSSSEFNNDDAIYRVKIKKKVEKKILLLNTIRETLETSCLIYHPSFRQTINEETT